MTRSDLIRQTFGSTGKPVELFLAEQFLTDLSPEDIGQLTPQSLKSIVATHLSLSASRRPGHPAIALTTNARANLNWDDRRTYIDLVHDDVPFLVNSVTSILTEKQYLIEMLIHPRVMTSRDKSGKSRPDSKGETRESHIHIAVKGTLSRPQIHELETQILEILADVHLATRDWQAMRLKALEAKTGLVTAPRGEVPAQTLTEFNDFLDYVYDNNFTFLGYREYRFERRGGKLVSRVVGGQGLGLLADDNYPAFVSETKTPLPPALQELRLTRPALTLSKVNRLSPVHRRVPMDALTVRKYDSDGNAVGEMLFVGLLTSVTYSRGLRNIPLLRQKAEDVQRRSGFEPASHDGRALRHILERYPRDELFQIDVDDLYAICLSILRLQERQRIALYCRKDPFRRYVSCLVYVPRERFDTQLRVKLQSILETEIGGTCSSYASSVDDSPLVRALFIISVSQSQPKSFDPSAIERLLLEAGRAWNDRLADALHQATSDDAEAERLRQRYGAAFSADYCDRYPLSEALTDIERIEACLARNTLTMGLSCENGRLSFKIYTPDQALALSDILPMLENMGLRVLTEHPFVVQPADLPHSIVLQDYALTPCGMVDPARFAQVKPLFEEAFQGLHAGTIENDTLNALILTAGLPPRDIMILRACLRYLRQTPIPYSLTYMEQALTTHPAIAAGLIALFKASFSLTPVKESVLQAMEAGILSDLDQVQALDHDRVLRGVLTLIKAMVRTNFFQTDADGNFRPYLSFKIKSREIPFLPDPKPFREIFVYSARMEGIHLRGDKIARGGLRWSDRHEDFRTEVLGLMKAQMVKNSVIVPVGSKGGFVVKRPPSEGGRAALQAEGIECYRILIRGLLDLTDNLKIRKVVKPKDVACRDEDDPYLVVAADKGTATFSDFANALSVEYGFWLGDAFASGGSAGYDHKKMGITARGAWESVKRHFRELNHDTQTQPFDVIGVGDMAGDVFGNGMLLSRQIRLVGVYNHVHIFCDPTPDPATSFTERKRLFDGVLGWNHYNLKKLSPGGRIYLRSEKVLELTPEIQKRFDLPKAKVSPPELIQAMLRARTDLLYFGGIGTYVKASHETHTEVGDRSNEPLRIDARELRAKVIAEGANLAMTQAARIEFAERGGRLNADFVDNSAGVDTSDHEVNIKILLSSVAARSPKALPKPQRNKLLATMTDDIAALVLMDNYQQTQAISLIEMQAASLLPEHQSFIQTLERDGTLNRALEGLPDDEKIAVRRLAGKGLTRPELGILVSYAKMRATSDLLATRLPDSTDLNDWLVGYFPAALQKKYKDDILKHPLRREIIATLVAGSIVNRLGPTFAVSRTAKFGVPVDAVVRAYVASVRVFDLGPLWQSIEALDAKVSAQTQLRAFRDFAKLLEVASDEFLQIGGSTLRIDSMVDRYAGPVRQIADLLATDKGAGQLLTSTQIQNIQQRQKTLLGEGLPPPLARVLAMRVKLALSLDVVHLAAEMKLPVERVAAVYYQLNERFSFGWLRQQIDYLPKTDHWSMEAADSLYDQIDHAQGRLTQTILLHAPINGKDKPADLLERWLSDTGAAGAAVLAQIAELRRTGVPDMMPLMVLLQRIGRLAAV